MVAGLVADGEDEATKFEATQLALTRPEYYPNATSNFLDRIHRV
jgi:hypothetical protein